MSKISLNTDIKSYPTKLQDKLSRTMDRRHWQYSMGVELKEWLRTSPAVPDLIESPQGWYKVFPAFTAHGEGRYIKTFGTRFEPIRPRPAKGRIPKEVNLDEWMGKHGRRLNDAKTREEFDKLWLSATPEERKEYLAVYRMASAIAALDGAPDDDFGNLDYNPTSLDLPLGNGLG